MRITKLFKTAIAFRYVTFAFQIYSEIKIL